jgi:mono/diheme cytochrome c family protein
MRGLVWVMFVGGVAACDGGEEGDRTADILALEGDVDAGAVVFTDTCELCHAAGAVGGSGPAIAGYADAEVLVDTVLSGKGTMPSFADQLEDQEVADVLAYVQSL